jgi:hypothetical protein
MNWYLRSCPVCSGDLHDDFDDGGWLTCFMCARSFRAADLPNLNHGAMIELDLEWVSNGMARPLHETEPAAHPRAA